MKNKQIVILIIIAIGLSAFLLTYKESSEVVSFKEASKHPNKSFPVKTTLVKDQPIEYNAKIDPEKFTFFAKDQNGEVRKVTCLKEKPQGFERSEELKLTGHFDENNEFIATGMQMKCPSKYEKELTEI
ncbi:MAG: cytochrome c maturation protein CcmE [Flavobacteriales bacterium]|nr:cytochrome c maturation protein CcmE [Flavobacteriales bacterium]